LASYQIGGYDRLMILMPAPRHRYSYSEYLGLEETSSQKNEYYDGEIYAMAGATPEHAALSAELIALLATQLRGTPCRVYTADLRIRVKVSGLATYPDVTVICGPIEQDTEGRNTATNPKLLVEVLSDSTEAYDRGEKCQHYMTIESLSEYVLVSQRQREVEVWRKIGDGWERKVARPGDVLQLQSVGLALDIGALYRNAIG
jgi:Uma2 family endonuclease